MEKCAEKIKRAVDANFNRAREGLRVIEDIARFVLDCKEVVQNIKNMRSEIAYIQKKYKDFLFFRDTETDVGTALTSVIEKDRDSLEDIVNANIKRVQESLRVLEEMFKVIDISESLKFKKMRYESYVIEKKILTSLEKNIK